MRHVVPGGADASKKKSGASRPRAYRTVTATALFSVPSRNPPQFCWSCAVLGQPLATSNPRFSRTLGVPRFDKQRGTRPADPESLFLASLCPSLSDALAWPSRGADTRRREMTRTCQSWQTNGIYAKACSFSGTSGSWIQVSKFLHAAWHWQSPGTTATGIRDSDQTSTLFHLKALVPRTASFVCPKKRVKLTPERLWRRRIQ